MKQKTKPLEYIVQAALIAAAYVALTQLSRVLGLADGAIQFRISEALTILPVFTPAAIPALTIGCFLANLLSFNGPLDLVIGTAASLIAAVLTYLTRRVRFKGLPIISSLFPVIVNAVMISWMLTFFIPEVGGSFWINAGFVALGQLVCCVGGGLPLFAALRKVPRLFPYEG